MTEQEKEIRRRRRLRRLQRERQVRRQKQMLAVALITVTAIIAGVVSIPQVLAEAPSSEAEALLPEATEEVAEASTEATEEETSEVQKISGTQVLEGVVVEEATEATESSETEVEETTETAEATESTEATTASAWMNYTSADVDLLANIMFAEEGVLYTKHYDTDPSDVEMVAKLCGSVVLHRLANNMGGATTIREVLYAQGQYAESTKTRIENGLDIPELFYVWAEELLQDGPLGPNNLVFQAEFAQGDVYAQYWNQVFGTSPYYPETE